MPWDMKDYPDSMKNMDSILRKKAIAIANALEAQGYDDDRSIPIAHAQAQEWFDNASDEEIEVFKEEEFPSKEDEHDRSGNVALLDNDVKVFYEEELWKVQTVGAKRADQTFEYKKDAIQRADEIAGNRESKVIIYKKDGDVQTERAAKD